MEMQTPVKSLEAVEATVKAPNGVLVTSGRGGKGPPKRRQRKHEERHDMPREANVPPAATNCKQSNIAEQA